MDRTSWQRLAGSCKAGADCEGIYLTNRGMVAVQGGYLVEAGVPAGEAVVEISPELLREAANALG